MNTFLFWSLSILQHYKGCKSDADLTYQLDLYVNKNSSFVANESEYCLEDYPCRTLSDAIDVANDFPYTHSHSNDIRIHLSGAKQDNSDNDTEIYSYYWSNNLTTWSEDDDAAGGDVSKWTVSGNSWEKTMIRISNAGIITPNKSSDITISDVTFTQDGSDGGSGQFWRSSTTIGLPLETRLTFKNVFMTNISRDDIFLEVYYRGLVVVEDSIIKDCLFSAGFMFSAGSTIMMYNTILENVNISGGLVHSMIPETESVFEDVTFRNSNISTFIAYSIFPNTINGSKINVNGLSFYNHYQGSCSFCVANTLLAGPNDKCSVNNIYISNSYFKHPFMYYEDFYGELFEINNILIINSTFKDNIFEIDGYDYSVSNSSVLGDYERYVTGENFIATNITLIDTGFDDELLRPGNFYYTEIRNITVYNSGGSIVVNNEILFHEDIILDDDDNEVGHHEIHNIKVYDIAISYCIICSYDGVYVNISDIYGDNIHPYNGWVWLDLEYSDLYEEAYVYVSNVYVNGHYLDYGYDDKNESKLFGSNLTQNYSEIMYNEAFVYYYYEIKYDNNYPDGNPDGFNGHGTAEEFCNHFINYNYNWTIIDNAFWGPVFLLDADIENKNFSCNMTFDTMYVSKSTNIYGNFWWTWGDQSFQPPPGIIYHYQDAGEVQLFKTVFINCIFENNKGFSIVQCDLGYPCNVEIRNSTFSNNTVTLNGTTLYNIVYMADDSLGVVNIYDSLFIGDYDSQPDGINSSFLYDPKRNNTFNCIRCEFRQTEYSDMPTSIPSAEPSNDPTSAPSGAPYMSPTMVPTQKTYYTLLITVQLQGNFTQIEASSDDDADYTTLVMYNAVVDILDTEQSDSYLGDTYQGTTVSLVFFGKQSIVFDVYINYTTWITYDVEPLFESYLETKIEDKDIYNVFSQDISDVVIEIWAHSPTTTDSSNNNASSNNSDSSTTALIIIGVLILCFIICIIVLLVRNSCFNSDEKRARRARSGSELNEKNLAIAHAAGSKHTDDDMDDKDTDDEDKDKDKNNELEVNGNVNVEMAVEDGAKSGATGTSKNN